MRRLKILLVVILSAWALPGYSQVVNFSQYHLEPQFTNPANIAANEFIEVILKYREQSLDSDLGFSTSGFTFLYPLFYNNPRRSFGGLAISVVDEQSGTSNLYRASGVYGGFAYKINLKRGHFLSMGLQAGYLSQRVDLSKITTDAQFVNGSFDPSSGTGETFKDDRVNAPIYNGGLTWFHLDRYGEANIFLGGAVYNINQPDFSFIGENDKLPLSVISHGGVTILRSDKFSIVPSFRWIYFEGSNHINAGSFFNYYFEAVNRNNKARSGKLELGAWYNNNDMAVLHLGVYISSLTIGLSYDLPFSSDINDQNFTNAVEVTLRWRFRKKGTVQYDYVNMFGGPKIRSSSGPRLEQEPEH